MARLYAAPPDGPLCRCYHPPTGKVGGGLAWGGGGCIVCHPGRCHTNTMRQRMRPHARRARHTGGHGSVPKYHRHFDIHSAPCKHCGEWMCSSNNHRWHVPFERRVCDMCRTHNLVAAMLRSHGQPSAHDEVAGFLAALRDGRLTQHARRWYVDAIQAREPKIMPYRKQSYPPLGYRTGDVPPVSWVSVVVFEGCCVDRDARQAKRDWQECYRDGQERAATVPARDTRQRAQIAKQARWQSKQTKRQAQPGFKGSR